MANSFVHIEYVVKKEYPGGLKKGAHIWTHGNKGYAFNNSFDFDPLISLRFSKN